MIAKRIVPLLILMGMMACNADSTGPQAKPSANLTILEVGSGTVFFSHKVLYIAWSDNYDVAWAHDRSPLGGADVFCWEAGTTTIRGEYFEPNIQSYVELYASVTCVDG